MEIIEDHHRYRIEADKKGDKFLRVVFSTKGLDMPACVFDHMFPADRVKKKRGTNLVYAIRHMTDQSDKGIQIEIGSGYLNQSKHHVWAIKDRASDYLRDIVYDHKANNLKPPIENVMLAEWLKTPKAAQLLSDKHADLDAEIRKRIRKRQQTSMRIWEAVENFMEDIMNDGQNPRPDRRAPPRWTRSRGTKGSGRR